MPTSAPARAGRHVIVIGAGGNIGSHLVPHLARMPEITRLTLVDPDRYVTHNLRNQAITAGSIGRSKVQVQAALARRINPWLSVRALADRVEDVPLGHLRGDMMLACLDSRRSRQHVNEIAWHLGVPWIDAGVLREGMMARIDLYVPASDAPCLECRWDAPDYQALEQEYPCGSKAVPLGGDTPSALGALAASMQALECQQWLTRVSASGALAAGDQVVLAASHHQHLRTAHRRNTHCRLADHVAWTIEPLALGADARTAGALLGALDRQLEGRADARTPVSLAVPGQFFVRKIMCPGCGASQQLLRLSRSSPPAEASCARCRRPMVVTGFGVTEQLPLTTITRADRLRSLRTIGVRDGDVVTVHTPTDRFHFELQLRAAHATTASEPRIPPMEAA